MRKVSEIADTLLQTHGLALNKAAPEYQHLCWELLKAQQVIFKAELDRTDGKYWDTESAAYQLRTASSANDTLSLIPSKLFSEIVALYFKEHTRQLRTDAQIKSGYEKFVQIVGGDRPIGEIAKVHCRQYKEAIGRLPRAIKAKDRGRSVVELLKSLPHAGKYQAIGVSSVNKYLHNLSHLFDWTKGQGYYEGENRVEGLTINKRQAGKEKRKPFSDEDLTRIFGRPDPPLIS